MAEDMADVAERLIARYQAEPTSARTAALIELVSGYFDALNGRKWATCSVYEERVLPTLAKEFPNGA